MARKYLIRYPNGMTRYISRLERDLLASSLTQISPREYAASSYQTEIEHMNGPRYLEGKFTIEQSDGQVVSERLETVMGMTSRLIRQGICVPAT